MMQDNGMTFFSPSKHIHLIRLRPIPVTQTLSTLHDIKNWTNAWGVAKKRGGHRTEKRNRKRTFVPVNLIWDYSNILT